MEQPKMPSAAPQPPKDPTASSRTWAIALIVSAIFLLAAIGVVVWIVLTRNAAPTVNTTPAPPADPAVGVKKISFVMPNDFPAAYVKHDQSKPGETWTFYDDEATACSVVLGLLPVDAAKTPQELVVARIADSYPSGVAAPTLTPGERFVVKDAEHEYSFDAITTEQTINLQGVGFTSRHQMTGFKKLGNQIVVIGYGCKADTWTQKQGELAALVSGITLKTER